MGEDVVERQWSAHGLLCRAMLYKTSYYNWRCGYVQVPPQHPFYRAEYNSPVSAIANIKGVENTPMEDVGIDGLLSAMALAAGDSSILDRLLKSPSGLVKVHWGLTFSGALDDNALDEWWFGFDTNHCDDYNPLMDFEKAKLDLARWKVGSESQEQLTLYLNHVKLGERERNFAYEAELSGLHYWTLNEIAKETEKMAEQLALIGQLGITKVA